MTTSPHLDEPTWPIPARLRLELLAYLSMEGKRPTLEMTYEEFLDWADEDTLAEWVDGKVIMTSPASLRHQEITEFLNGVMKAFARVHDLGRIVSAPFQMKLARSGREPDVIYVSREHAARLRPTFVDGPADLVVEVLSPESIGRDRGDKFFEYQEAGIPEYWLIESATQRAEFYLLNDQGIYAPAEPGADGTYHARALPGFWLRVDWLWEDPLPPLERAALAIMGAAYARFLRDELARQGYSSPE